MTQASSRSIRGSTGSPVKVGWALVLLAVTSANAPMGKGWGQQFTAAGKLSGGTNRDLASAVAQGHANTSVAGRAGSGLPRGTGLGSLNGS